MVGLHEPLTSSRSVFQSYVRLSYCFFHQTELTAIWPEVGMGLCVPLFRHCSSRLSFGKLHNSQRCLYFSDWFLQNAKMNWKQSFFFFSCLVAPEIWFYLKKAIGLQRLQLNSLCMTVNQLDVLYADLCVWRLTEVDGIKVSQIFSTKRKVMRFWNIDICLTQQFRI